MVHPDATPLLQLTQRLYVSKMSVPPTARLLG
jgi:hypothetical protein